MQVQILSEYGHDEALLGLGLSFGKTSGMSFKDFLTPNNSTPVTHLMERRADKLAGLGKGHDKFLRMCVVTLDITAPLYWWKQFDTYKIGTTAQSESTMHTLMKHPITPAMFEGNAVKQLSCLYYNVMRKAGHFNILNKILPQSFLQRRIVQTNYAALRAMLEQRTHHKLPEWQQFCNTVRLQAHMPGWLA